MQLNKSAFGISPINPQITLSAPVANGRYVQYIEKRGSYYELLLKDLLYWTGSWWTEEEWLCCWPHYSTFWMEICRSWYRNLSFFISIVEKSSPFDTTFLHLSFSHNKLFTLSLSLSISLSLSAILSFSISPFLSLSLSLSACHIHPLLLQYLPCGIPNHCHTPDDQSTRHRTHRADSHQEYDH